MGKSITQLENELLVLREIINRTWSKGDELSRLKVQCEALQKNLTDFDTSGKFCWATVGQIGKRNKIDN